ncbi:MAG TPA: hypothetical protein VK625_20170, partial [Flavitalea sp.]|nr:hypothetical protein [Flavitalea sp.]
MSVTRQHKLKYVVLLMIGAMLFTFPEAFSQKISSAEKKELRKKEDTLARLSRDMVFGPEPGQRFRADSNFIRTFVRALKTKNAFFYPFDSLNISRLYA